MKTINRFTLGLVSSLLLAAGFSTLAQSIDPLSQATAYTQASADDLSPAGACARPCSSPGDLTAKV